MLSPDSDDKLAAVLKFYFCKTKQKQKQKQQRVGAAARASDTMTL
jgi:hypothetical protein